MATDTTPDAAAVQQALYRAMTGEQRVAIALKMSIMARQITLDGIRFRHPEYSDEQAKFALFRILVGDVLFRKAWPSAELVDP
jgi:hypothetical protein